MKHQPLSTAVVCTLATLAVVAAPSMGAGTKTIVVKDNAFAPAKLTVARGTNVRWVWKGDNPHNVTASGAATFHSPTQSSGSFSKRLSKSGTYRILCTVHAGMKLSLRVK